MKSNKNFLKIFGAVLVCLITAAGFAYYQFKHRFTNFVEAEQKSSAIEAAKYWPLFLEDEKQLSSLAIFSPKPRTKNASGVSNPKIHSELVKSLTALGDKWTTIKDSVELQKIDFSWMHSLLEADYWEIEISETPTPSEVFKSGESIKQERNYSELLNWVKLRLADSFRTQTLPAALHEVYHLAELLYSTESMSASITMTEVLKLGITAQEFGNQSGINTATDWTITRSDVERLRRTMLTYPAFMDFFLAKTYSPKLGDAKVGICQALNGSTIRFATEFRPIFQPDFGDFYSSITSLLNQHSECRLKTLRAIWMNDRFLKDALEGKDFFAESNLDGKSEPARNSPFDIYTVSSYAPVRQEIAINLLSIAKPNPWVYYPSP